ncbi:metalloregulator ArsR/SmtB family transcription factor [Emcibacter sp. SYSU 3D8]|uniref:ArsR/SmtB family transcription factor n=1 Tax=Emcibacter sp. SYSU 3D8 TaxID=3133969 RepID=UPI0031FE79ED
MTALYQDRDRAEAAANTLKVYAQTQRLMILSCLLRGERTVGDIDSLTGIGQPALSQQLAGLRQAELVRSRREAKQVYYDLAGDRVRLCVRALEAIMGGDDVAAAMEALQPAAGDDTAEATPAGSAAFARVG